MLFGLGLVSAHARVQCFVVKENLDQIDGRLSQVTREDGTLACEKKEFKDSEGVIKVKIFCDDKDRCSDYERSVVPKASNPNKITNCDNVIVGRNQARILAFGAHCDSEASDKGCTSFKCDNEGASTLNANPCVTYSSSDEIETAKYLLEENTEATLVEFSNFKSPSGMSMEVHFKTNEACNTFKSKKCYTKNPVPGMKDIRKVIKKLK